MLTKPIICYLPKAKKKYLFLW